MNLDNPAQSNREIFLAALDMTDGKARQALLEEACGEDVERRREIERLLAAHQTPAANPLDRAVERLGPAETLGSELYASLELDHVAVLLHEIGDDEQAEQEYRIAISMLADFASRADNNADVVDSPGALLRGAHLHLGEYLSARNRNAEAEANYREAIKFTGEQARAFPDVGYYQSLLGKSYLALGKMLLVTNRIDEAKQSLTEASRILDALLVVSDEVPAFRRLAEEAKLRLSEIESIDIRSWFAVHYSD